MNVSMLWLKRPVSFCLAAMLVVPLCGAETPLPSAPQPAGIAAAAAEAGARADAGGQQTSSVPQTASSPQAGQAQQESSSQVQGTAAGPAIKPEGVPASRPAGAAIAPGKQRRIRVLAIRWGLIIGAAAAVGIVAAASLGSPARP